MKRIVIFLTLYFFAKVAYAIPALVSAEWLMENIGSPDIYLVEVVAREADDVFDLHIPHSIKTIYSQDGWVESSSEMRGILPDLDDLEDVVTDIGISNKKHVVLVPMKSDANTIAASIRIYWILRMLGKRNVSIVDGGYEVYAHLQDAPLTERSIKPIRKLFSIDTSKRTLATTEMVQTAVSTDSALIDLRLPVFYEGEQKHLLADFAGTIPGAENVPWNRLISDDGKFRPRNELRELFADATGDPTTTHIVFSETGHVAAIGWFILSELLNFDDVKIYDDGYLYWQSLPTNKVQSTYEDFGFSGIYKN
jgi:thiosulfate/3-mercaptopyruvate sulfurtransferase